MKSAPSLKRPKTTAPALQAKVDARPRWYNRARWKGPNGLRAQQLSQEPLCEDCKEQGLVTEATIVHHEERHGGDAAAFFNSTLRSLCAECHQVRTNRGE